MPENNLNELINSLDNIKTEFFKKASNKIRLINKISKTQITNVKLLIKYHDLISFLRAYPDNTAVLKAADKELREFSKRIDHYKSVTRDKNAEKLLNSGIINTVVEHPFSLGIVKLLCKHYPEHLSVDWDNLLEDVPNEIFSILQLLVAWHENDALDNDDYIDLPTWLEIASQGKSKSDVERLINYFNSSELSESVQDYLYEKIDLPVRWELKNSQASRTLQRSNTGKIFYQKESIKKRSDDLRAELKKTTAPLKRLAKKEALKAIRIANEVLAVRYRELHPLTYADPNEVYTYQPGRGISIYIFGSQPSIRLPLESNFGAMLTRNGLPIGYGVAATLLDRVEIAMNVFPAFRNGESAFIIEQFFKLFYKHFNSRVFLARSYQMGDGDDEPIFAGSFWFYYKLGFRAVNEKIRKMAEVEFAKINSKPGYRSSHDTLRKLSKSDVFMHSDSTAMDSWEDISMMNLGYVVTKHIGSRYNGDIQKAEIGSIKKLEKVINLRGWKKWAADEITALKRMAPLVVNFPNLSKFAKTDKDKLVEIIRSKGSKQERKFVLLSTRNKTFIDSLRKLSKSSK